MGIYSIRVYLRITGHAGAQSQQTTTAENSGIQVITCVSALFSSNLRENVISAL